MKQIFFLSLPLIKPHQLFKMTHGLGQSPDQQLINHLSQELIILKERRENQEQIKHLKINPLPILRQATFIKIEQPLQIIDQIILENSKFLSTRTYTADTRYFSAHQVAGTHKFMRVEV